MKVIDVQDILYVETVSHTLFLYLQKEELSEFDHMDAVMPFTLYNARDILFR